jgi:caffeoyl-CoA O-methyltransferase
MPMTPERWDFLIAYANEVFPHADPQLETLMDRAAAAGLPRIAVSPDVGRLLKILCSLTPGRLALELGTLAGYSGIWIARGLSAGGRLVTVELDPRHADFAEAEFATAGVADRVEVVRGAALDVLPDLAVRLGPSSVDFAFVDAIKSEYVAYLEALKPLLAPGAVMVADNVYGTGQGWIDQGHGTDDFNRAVASDPEFESTITPMREGLLIARKR